MKKDEDEKKEIIQAINKLTQELEELNASLEYKEGIINEYDKVINNSEMAYTKLLEGSQTLLAILQRDENALKQKINNN